MAASRASVLSAVVAAHPCTLHHVQTELHPPAELVLNPAEADPRFYHDHCNFWIFRWMQNHGASGLLEEEFAQVVAGRRHHLHTAFSCRCQDRPTCIHQRNTYIQALDLPAVCKSCTPLPNASHTKQVSPLLTCNHLPTNNNLHCTKTVRFPLDKLDTRTLRGCHTRPLAAYR